MISFFLSLSTLAGCIVSMALATAAGLLVYGISYKVLSKYRSGDLKDPISSLFRAIGLLVGLMLSLAFAEVIVELRAVENAIEREAISIRDMHKDLQRYDHEETREIRAVLVDYTRSLINDDWPALANDRLGEKTTALKKQLTELVWSMEPATPLQKTLWPQILADLKALSDHR